MTTDEKLDLLVEKVSGIDDRLLNLENKFDAMQADVTELKELKPQLEAMQRDVDVLKRTAVWAETDLQRKVNVLLENHSDLSKNVNVAKDIEERVGVVEFDVKVIKALLNRTQPKISFSS